MRASLHSLLESSEFGIDVCHFFLKGVLAIIPWAEALHWILGRSSSLVRSDHHPIRGGLCALAAGVKATDLILSPGVGQAHLEDPTETEVAARSSIGGVHWDMRFSDATCRACPQRLPLPAPPSLVTSACGPL